MKRHFEPQPERFWEKYAIIPFFLAFAAAGVGFGYMAAKDRQDEIKEIEKYEMKEFLQKQHKTR